MISPTISKVIAEDVDVTFQLRVSKIMMLIHHKILLDLVIHQDCQKEVILLELIQIPQGLMVILQLGVMLDLFYNNSMFLHIMKTWCTCMGES